MTDRRRQTDRQSKRVAVKYGKDAPEFLGHTKNVSPTGLKLEGRHVFPKGAILHLEFGDPPVARLGRVIWVKAMPAALTMAGNMPTMGIRFKDAPTEAAPPASPTPPTPPAAAP